MTIIKISSRFHDNTDVSLWLLLFIEKIKKVPTKKRKRIQCCMSRFSYAKIDSKESINQLLKQFSTDTFMPAQLKHIILVAI